MGEAVSKIKVCGVTSFSILARCHAGAICLRGVHGERLRRRSPGGKDRVLEPRFEWCEIPRAPMADPYVPAINQSLHIPLTRRECPAAGTITFFEGGSRCDRIRELRMVWESR